MPEPVQMENDMQSNNSFNEDQSQTASVENASEIESTEMQQLLDTAEERMTQAEQRALKAEESAQVASLACCSCNTPVVPCRATMVL